MKLDVLEVLLGKKTREEIQRKSNTDAGEYHPR